VSQYTCLLLRQMAELAAALEQPELGRQCLAQAGDADEKVKPLRELVVDPALFGHTPHSEGS
jgi:hypothetical protein